MDSQNIFDLFGRQKKQDETKIDTKILTLKSEFTNGFNLFKDHIRKTENLVNAISLSKNYLSVNKRRIVSAKPSVDKNDVIIKSELNEVIDSMIKIGDDLKKFDERCIASTKDFVDFKTEISKSIKKNKDTFINLETYVKDEFTKYETKLNAIDKSLSNKN